MKSGPMLKVAFKRKREQKTNYKKRLALLKSKTKRFVVRLSNKLVKMQIIDYKKDGDITLLSVTSNDLKKFGWSYALNNTPAIYLTALLLSEKAKKKNIKKVVFDIGARNFRKKSKIFAALKAVVDSKLECPYNEEAFPLIDRIEGNTISKYKNNNLSKDFKLIKEKILNS